MSLDLGHNSSHKQTVQDTVGGALIETYITIRQHTVLREVREVIRACQGLDLRARKGRYATSGVCNNGTGITPLSLKGLSSCSFYKINYFDQSPSSDADSRSVQQNNFPTSLKTEGSFFYSQEPRNGPPPLPSLAK